MVRLFAPVFRLRWVLFVCTLTDIYTPPDNRLQRQQIEIHLMYEGLGLVYTARIRIHAIALLAPSASLCE